MTQQTTRQSQQPAAAHVHHGRPSLPTAEIELSPDFLEALRKIAPVKRRRTAPYVLLAMVAVILGVAFVPGARQRVLTSAHRLLDREAAAATAAPPADAMPVQAPAAPPVAAPPAVVPAPGAVEPTVAPPKVTPVDDLPSQAPQPTPKSKKAPKKFRGRATR